MCALQREPWPFAGKVTADQVKLILGEKGNVWPDSILLDANEAGGVQDGSEVFY